MARRPALLIAAIVLGTAVLLALGTWQVRRLQWKEALIAEVEERRHSEPLGLAQVEARWRETGDVDYVPLTVAGRFDHAGEQYFYTTHRGAVGWNVYTPLILADGRALMVNRGFVPDNRREPATRLAGQLEGAVTVAGLARNPIDIRPNRFVPDNRPDSRTWYWKDLPAMARAGGVEKDAVVPIFLDAGVAEVPGGLPEGGTTIVAFPNNHLQYAITWYGLALALVGVGGYFLYASRRA